MQTQKVAKSNIKVEKKKRIVVISDTHITDYGTEFNLKIFNQGMRKINRIKDVNFYLHLGDLTHSGTLLDYEYALVQMNKLIPYHDAPVYYIIGNHDALNVGYLLFEEIIGKRYIEYEDEDLYMIGIDSTKPDLASGIIHQNTINSVKTSIEQSNRTDKLKLVCFHHQTIPIPKTGKERSAIDDSGDMIQMLLNSNADLVLNGHRHISNLYNVCSPKKDLYLFNSGTFSCNKTRYRELFTYNVIDIIGNRITFNIIPVIDTQFKQKIHRNVNYYNPRSIKKNEKPYCKILQLSNTLIDLNVKNELDHNILKKLITKVNEIPDIDLIVHNGNLTRNGYESEFIQAKHFLHKFKYPIIVVPGPNESSPASLRYWQEEIGPLDPSYKDEKLFFQGINSCTQHTNTGYIGRKKLRVLIEEVMRFSKEKICGFTCYHGLIPTPLSLWRTELTDSGDVLSNLALSQIDLILNSTPSISFNLKVENSLISNGGNLQTNYFNESFIEIDIYTDGVINLTEHFLKRDIKNLIGSYQINIFS